MTNRVDFPYFFLFGQFYPSPSILREFILCFYLKSERRIEGKWPANKIKSDPISILSILTKLDSPTFFSQKTVKGSSIFTRLGYILFKPLKIAKRALQKGTPDKKKASHFCKALIIKWRIAESNRWPFDCQSRWV